MKKIVSLILKKLLKICPECGSKLENETRLEYVPAYGEDPPYRGTFRIRTLRCSECTFTSQEAKPVAGII